MGKRKKATKKPSGPRRNEPLGMSDSNQLAMSLKITTDTSFTCLFCNHDNSVSVRVDRKEGIAHLVCKVCDQRYQSKVNRASSNSIIRTVGSKTVPLQT